MTIQLNHTIVSVRDQEASARFLTDILGLPAPTRYGPFTVVQTGETSLDFRSTNEAITSRHYAFLVSETEFDEIFGRIRAKGVAYWADPHHTKPGQINTRDGGRGCYFDDPDGHNLEILTRSYGSGE